MSATVSIILKMIDDASGGMGKVTKSWTELSSAVGLGKQAFNEVAQIAKQAYAVVKEGADIELAEMRFDRLAASIGTTGDALMNDLGPAVGGMLSQADQMKLAGDLMSLGLAKTSDEAIRLTGVASQLGMDMNQLVLTLTNQTTMRFDALGVAVDGFDAKVKALEATGLSADEAFKWAFIEQAEAQIERVGSVADTTAGELMKLEAGLADLKNEAALTAAELAGPVVSKINDSRDALALLNELFDTGAIGVGEYVKVQAQLRTPLGDTEAILEDLQEKQDDYNRAMERGYDIAYRYTGATQALTNASQSNIHVFEQSGGVVDFYASRAAAAEQASYNLGAAIRDAGAAQSTTNSALAAAGEFYSNMSTNVGSLTTALQEQLDFIAAGGGVAVALVNAANQALAAGDFELAQTLADQASIAATDIELELEKMDATAAAEKLAADLGIGFDEAQQMVADLQASIFAMTAQTYMINFGLSIPGANAGGSSIPGITAPGGTTSGGGVGGGWNPLPMDTAVASPGMTATPVSGGGTTVQILGDIIVQDGTDFLQVIAEMAQRGARSQAAARAGVAYSGRM